MEPIINDTDLYVFRIYYTIIRKGDGGKVLERPRTDTSSSVRHDGRDLVKRIKERFGENTRIEKIAFQYQYDPVKEYERMMQAEF